MMNNKKDMVAFGYVFFGDNSGKTTCKEYYEKHDLKYIHEHMTKENYELLLSYTKHNGEFIAKKK